MNQKQFLLTLLLAVISAFLGGTVGVWFLMPPSVLAQDETPKVIEAEEFRVVDAVGRARAVLDSIGLSIYAPPNEEPVASYNFMGLSAQSEVGAVKLVPAKASGRHLSLTEAILLLKSMSVLCSERGHL